MAGLKSCECCQHFEGRATVKDITDGKWRECAKGWFPGRDEEGTKTRFNANKEKAGAGDCPDFSNRNGW